MKRIRRFTSIEKVSSIINEFLDKLYDLFITFDCPIVCNGKRINLSSNDINKFDVDKNTDFYLDGFKSISTCREAIKSKTENFFNNLNILNYKLDCEYRTKNINSIFAKIYHYNNEKNERGEIPIKKCLNDLFGVRIILPIRNFEKLRKMLINICKGKKYLKIINSSKMNYKAMHIYLIKDNFSMQWEIQFWLKKDDKINRDSHSKYKQEYTKWESLLTGKKIVSEEL